MGEETKALTWYIAHGGNKNRGNFESRVNAARAEGDMALAQPIKPKGRHFKGRTQR